MMMARDKASHTRTALMAFIGALLILLVVIVVNIAGLAASSSPSTRSGAVLWRGGSEADAINLEEAVSVGIIRAREWSADVQLIRAEAAWRPTREGQEADNPPVSWSLYYFSPRNNALASALVTGEKVFWVPPIELANPPQPINDLPSQSVEVAWLTFRAAGGDEYLLRHKDAMINFRLYMKGDVLVWSVSAFDDRGKHNVILDAVSGILIQETLN